MTHADQMNHCRRFFATAITKFARESLTLMAYKSGDYNPQPMAMTEAFVAASDIDSDVPRVLWVHVRKHVAAIANHMAGGELQTDDVRQRLMDVAVYMALIDSYMADPVRWLTMLDTLIESEKLGDRTEDEMERLTKWMMRQFARYSDIDLRS